VTDQQATWIDMQKMVVLARPDFETTNVPKARWRKPFHRLVSKNGFDIFIMACIFLNMMQMAGLYETASYSYKEILDIINLVFTTIFTVEAILKLIAYGSSYFNNNWNRFDFTVVVASLIEVAFSRLSQSSLKFLRLGPQLIRVLRVLRVSRILRLIGKYEGIQALISTITFSLYSLFNVFSLLLLIFFIFSILGVFMFSGVSEGDEINEFMNFHNFGMAMLLLMRVATGEDWNKIMYDCMKTPPNCIPNKTCGTAWAPFYFISFILICSDVMLNLFILVILQQFDKYYLPKDNVMAKFKRDLQNFKDTWKDFTMERYSCIKIKESMLVPFFQKLREPLGLPYMKDEEVHKVVLKMGIKSIDGYVYFNELLYRAIKRLYGNVKMTKELMMAELRTQYKILLISLRAQKQGNLEKNREAFHHFVGNNTTSVNPYLTLMYLKVSFAAWFRASKGQLAQHETVYVEYYESEIEYESVDSEEERKE